MIGAAAKLFDQDQLAINVKFCTVHILRNLSARFSLRGQPFEGFIWWIQSDETKREYDAAMVRL